MTLAATKTADRRDAGESGAAVGAGAGDQASRLRSLVRSMEPSRPPDAHLLSRGAVQMRPARGARLLTVASGKGGVGKTNIAVNLAIALADQKLRVVLLDADLGVANADVLCGLHPDRRLDRVFNGADVDALAAIPPLVDQIAVPAPGGFRLVPGIAGLLRSEQLTEAGCDRLLGAIADLDQASDVIVIDASPGVGPTVTGMLAAADLGLIVTTPEPTAIADAYALIKCMTLTTGALDRLALVVNGAADRAQAEATRDRIFAVAQRFLGRSPRWGGWIAQDEHVRAAVFARRPFLLRSPSAPASRAVRTLATHAISTLFGQTDPAGGEDPPSVVGHAPLSRRLWGMVRGLSVR
ncbi:MAG: P-loop NTPase [Phycisphaerales bacterium]